MGCSTSRQCQILILVGSARKHSVNAGLVEEIQSFAVDKGVKLRFVIPSLEHLPVFNEDEERKILLPKEIKKLRRRAEESDAVLFITPQINGSVSPLVLNAFLWLSRAYDKLGSPLQCKKAAVMSASYLSENQIIDCIEMGRYFNMRFFNEPFYLFLGNKVINESGRLTSAYQRGRLQRWYNQFILFILKE